MEKLGKEILKEIKHIQNYDILEYGNLRKSEVWGEKVEENIKWGYYIDLVTAKPVHYVINYSIKEKLYSCYAKTSMNNLSSVFQFETKDIDELTYRLKELALHIPSLRERILREYLYNVAKKGPNRKWYHRFFKTTKLQEYIESVIQNLLDQNKITIREADKVRIYSRELT